MRQQIIDDFKQFFSENKEQILAKVVRIEDLPPNDEWFDDDYEDERGQNERTENRVFKKGT